MGTRVDEIADGIYRISTWVAEVASPAGFSFNQFLITGDEVLLFPTEPWAMFPLVSEAVARVVPVESLRWITFCHIESDVGSGAGAVALSGVRSRSHFSPGFPCGPLHCGDHGRVLRFQPPAASNRACGSPAHGSPTPFTAGIRLFPPGLSRPGCDDDSIQADQAELIR